MNKYWLLLYLAIGLEICGTLSLKVADGFTKLAPSAVVLVAYGASFVCMSKAMQYIDVGVAYAIWSAVGIVSIALFSLLLFGETLTMLKVLAYMLIIGGVAILNFAPTS